jgi:hypothetical protein
VSRFPYLRNQKCLKDLSMNYELSFQERARLGSEQLSKQLSVTLEQARQQAQRLKASSRSKVKKQSA